VSAITPLCPCPFCGETDIGYRSTSGPDGFYVHVCMGCGAEGPPCMGIAGDARAGSAERWNRRPAPAGPLALVGALVAYADAVEAHAQHVLALAPDVASPQSQRGFRVLRAGSGIGVTWHGGPLICAPTLSRALAIIAEANPIAGVTTGDER
jgi:hypothetical protein